MQNESNSFLDLPDEQLMLALCVRAENLKDSARWCAEMREHARAVKKGPSTVEEAEALMAESARLAAEAAGTAGSAISNHYRTLG